MAKSTVQSQDKCTKEEETPLSPTRAREVTTVVNSEHELFFWELLLVYGPDPDPDNPHPDDEYDLWSQNITNAAHIRFPHWGSDELNEFYREHTSWLISKGLHYE